MSYFIDQCLDSVKRACADQTHEIIVVDNASKDDSVSVIRNNYPDVKLIANSENYGFSKANNQGIEVASGEWILLLNPDTVLGEKTLSSALEFVKDKPDCGALGIRMINGKGEFLPESKRGLPTPAVAFYKLSGLSKIFPRSKRFNQYHAGNISESENAEIDILSGAFMMIRSAALEKSGLLDETFFMYGEDIDLSYRIKLAGYRNYYFADEPIIHYKGESTKKSSVNYVFVFYYAMVIFAKKHFGKKNAGLFNFIINSGIYARASIAIISRVIRRLLLPTIDLILITAGLFALSNRWHIAGIDFPETAFNVLIPFYVLIWIISSLINGVYDRISSLRIIKGSILGTLLILVFYALLPKDWQFSRLFILSGMLWIIFYYLISRIYFALFSGKPVRFGKSKKRNFAIIGIGDSALKTKDLLERTQAYISKILLFDSFPTTKELENVDEVIFCSQSISYASVIEYMIKLRGRDLEFKMAPGNRNYLIGSNSIDTAGDLYLLEINKLVSKENQRKKRMFDTGLSFFLLILSPTLIFSFENKSQFVRNLLLVLRGKKTFIGYSESSILSDHRLPKTMPGILSPCDEIPKQNEELCEKLNLIYARDYSIRKDLRIILGAWKKLDH